MASDFLFCLITFAVLLIAFFQNVALFNLSSLFFYCYSHNNFFCTTLAFVTMISTLMMLLSDD